MLERLKRWFGKKSEPIDPIYLPYPDLDATDDVEADAPLPPEILAALARWPARPAESREIVIGERFRVQRIHAGVTYQAYAGDVGGDARRAWEAYQASDLSGQFVFMDGDDCRGSFTR